MMVMIEVKNKAMMIMRYNRHNLIFQKQMHDNNYKTPSAIQLSLLYVMEMHKDFHSEPIG